MVISEILIMLFFFFVDHVFSKKLDDQTSCMHFESDISFEFDNIKK